jgi:hypothetical protein
MIVINELRFMIASPALDATILPHRTQYEFAIHDVEFAIRYVAAQAFPDSSCTVSCAAASTASVPSLVARC